MKKFTDWVTSFVPGNIRETVSKKAESLKEQVHRILVPDDDDDDELHDALEYPDEDLEPIQQETVFDGYLGTHRLKGLK